MGYVKCIILVCLSSPVCIQLSTSTQWVYNFYSIPPRPHPPFKLLHASPSTLVPFHCLLLREMMWWKPLWGFASATSTEAELFAAKWYPKWDYDSFHLQINQRQAKIFFFVLLLLCYRGLCSCFSRTIRSALRLRLSSIGGCVPKYDAKAQSVNAREKKKALTQNTEGIRRKRPRYLREDNV